MVKRWTAALALLLVSIVMAASSPAPVASAQRPTPVDPGDPVLIGAGDICVSSSMSGAAATAQLIEERPWAHVFTLGDNSNESGRAEQYAACYARTWGRFLDRTRPTIGNHDCYDGAACAGYYSYFGAAAGPAGRAYYSYDLPNDWHVIVLNSLPERLASAGRGSPQETWLRRDLRAHHRKHLIAMWHITVFDSEPLYRVANLPFWEDLYDARADIILNAHHHYYERFAPMNPSGQADPGGIRLFTVGTGGAPAHPFGATLPASEDHETGTFGVLVLTLHPHSYDWNFVPVEGGSFMDSGSQATHS